MPSSNMVTPTTQLISRGLRNAPVKKIRAMCTTMAATNIRAAQWWIWRITSPARTSKLREMADRYAADISTPCSFSKLPL